MALLLRAINEQELDCFIDGKLSDLLLLNLSCVIDDLRTDYE